jgi:hypothetical protein
MAPKPLAGLHVVEVVRRDSASIALVAVAFAGHLVAALGGRVTRVLLGCADPLQTWPPLLPDGSSALHRFLNGSKGVADAIPSAAHGLITDDPELAGTWTSGNVVVVAASPPGASVAHSELTVLAAAGLLDIFGEPDAPPLPLPGHQAAYAAGMTAFNAFIAAHWASGAGAPPSTSRVSVVDVALWLNWKHYLASYLHLPNVGIGRVEEWKTYPCRDGYIAFVFQDKDLGRIAALTGDARFAEDRFATPRSRRENMDAFCRSVAAWASERTRNEIVTRARGIGLPIGPVLRIGELLADPQLLAREFIDLASGSPTFGLPRLPVVWTDTTAGALPEAGPRHDRDVMRSTT